MNSRPKDPKTARNKNVLIVGGSAHAQVRKAERPSVLEKLQHFKSLIQAAVVDRTKRKELER